MTITLTLEKKPKNSYQIEKQKGKTSTKKDRNYSKKQEKNIEENIDQLIGRYVDYFFMGKSEPVTNKIESVEITPSKYNNREVKIYTEDELMDIFPLSELANFMNGEEVKIGGKGGDAYIITLKNMMEQGGGLEKGKLYLIGKPEVNVVGRFNTKISNFKTFFLVK